ncbi:hypothetical protein GXW82_17410 [Streptacidiphilus sp. 4-A2]|nr:hypothetical protein [Streptacidiphilus sp. 4-A2]
MTASALTQLFDPAVTSGAGDPFAVSVDPAAAATHPVLVLPGASVTLPVTVTPHGATGSQVHGVLYLVTAPNSVLAGNQYFVPLSGAVLGPAVQLHRGLTAGTTVREAAGRLPHRD